MDFSSKINPKEASVEITITRADGTIEKLGTVSYYHRNPLKRLVWNFKNNPKALNPLIKLTTFSLNQAAMQKEELAKIQAAERERDRLVLAAIAEKDRQEQELKNAAYELERKAKFLQTFEENPIVLEDTAINLIDTCSYDPGGSLFNLFTDFPETLRVKVTVEILDTSD